MATSLSCTLSIAVALLATTTAGAQQSYAPNARVDSVFAQYDRPDVPGCVVGVYKDGAIVYARGYGSANLEHRIALTPQSMLDIGSMGKQFTAAVVTLLAQEGKLSLDDDIRKYIPELPDYGHTITLRHLFHHTRRPQGLQPPARTERASSDDVTTDDDALTVVARQKALNFQPGSEFVYNNTGYFLLSLVVKRVTGESLQDVARERLFTPLGMRRTHFLRSYDAIVPDRAIGYSPVSGSGFRSDMPRWLQIGDGGVWSSVEELFLWDRNFYDARIGGRAMIDTLEQAGRLTSGESTNYGVGLSITSYRGHRAVGHGGSWGGYMSQLTRYPDQRLSIAVLCNRSDAEPVALAARVADIFLPVSSRRINNRTLCAPGGQPAAKLAAAPYRHVSRRRARDENSGGSRKAAPVGPGPALRTPAHWLVPIRDAAGAHRGIHQLRSGGERTCSRLPVSGRTRRLYHGAGHRDKSHRRSPSGVCGEILQRGASEHGGNQRNGWRHRCARARHQFPGFSERCTRRVHIGPINTIHPRTRRIHFWFRAV